MFCSTARPAYAFEEDGQLITHYLDLYDLAGYQQSSGLLYARFCHGNSLTIAAAPRAWAIAPARAASRSRAGGPRT